MYLNCDFCISLYLSLKWGKKHNIISADICYQRQTKKSWQQQHKHYGAPIGRECAQGIMGV